MVNELLQKTFYGKRVFVTGHTGFKGAWLAWVLKELGSEIYGYALGTLENNIYSLTGLQSELVCDQRADIQDIDSLSQALKQARPDFVFHLAAQPLVRQSYTEPLETYRVNLLGTLNLLECIRQYQGKLTSIFVTTDKCYENTGQIWGYRETEALGGHDPYSSSKGCCEIALSSWQRSFFPLETYNEHQKALVTVRAGNIIGGGDRSPDRIIPDAVRAIETGLVLKIRNPFAVRPWQHVLEPVFAYLNLAAKLALEPKRYAGPWNIGPDSDSCISVGELIRIFHQKAAQGKVECPDSKDYRLHEAEYLTLDNTKAKRILGWEPRLDIETALEWAAHWYFQAPSSVEGKRELTLRQIRNYKLLS